ncbi:MAG: hypothetical protein C5B60_08195 [Chloroflexi bacterium]|nr:MAG: hypothetical protein C5B60_08195 [Chloroflexota bacterium]
MDSLAEQDYTVSHVTQTFVVQVQDQNVGFCPGIVCLQNLNSTTPLWPVQLAIYDVGVKLSVSRVGVTSP